MRFALAVFWWRSNLSFSEGRLGRAFLRFAAPFTKLRRFPVIGPGLRWVSAKLLPRDALTWVQVQRGPARGIWLHLNPRTGRDYFNGDVEPEVQAVLRKYLRPGMTVYDIGANIGFFSLLAARLVGTTGRVTAFEADPEIVARLREHVERNQGAPISAEEKAVWSTSTPVFFARADAEVSPDRGLGHVIDNDAERSAAPGTIRVEAVTVDEYVRQSGAPDFIKCDVEGAEVEVFRGAKKLLDEKQPLILCEMHGEQNRQTLLKVFANLGYRCEPCGTNHILAQRTK
jgi:FkbM family methyltransferase